MQFDAIQLEVMWNRLIAVVNEQAKALMRTSFTTIVREAGDLSAGVFDARGYMIAQAVTGTPGHINAMATCIHHFLAEYPAETLRPGDVLITNDPQKTSGHLHDFTVITPVFLDGATLVGFFGNCCHVLDIGGHWSLDRRPLDLRRGALSSRSPSSTTGASRTASCSRSSRPTCARRSRCWAISTPRSPATMSARRGWSSSWPSSD